ncbi:MAG TPA: hypothetical protein VHF22_11825, partial [Planctomycetota bacterium]|nr:hypothetical protein [Planctomycetota bacterium]
RCYAEADVRRKFCCRTAEEVLADGHIHYATPCHDLVTAAGAALRAEGFRPVPVLCRIRRLFQPVKFQCGLELDLDGAPHYLGFSVTTNRLAPGRFVPVRSRTHVLRADPDAAPPGAPHLAFFGLGAPADVDRAIAGHVLEKHLRSYRSTTSPRAYERARLRALEKAGSGEVGLLGPGRWAVAASPSGC